MIIPVVVRVYDQPCDGPRIEDPDFGPRPVGVLLDNGATSEKEGGHHEEAGEETRNETCVHDWPPWPFWLKKVLIFNYTPKSG